MNLEQLEYIVEVANQRSISKAAKKLYITPSAISQSISQLENELKITIFNRSSSGTLPTKEGKMVITKATHIVNSVKGLNSEISDFNNSRKSHLKIAAGPTFFYILQELILDYTKKNSEITFEIEEITPKKMNHNFVSDHFDFGFIVIEKEDVENDINIEFELLHKGNLCVAVGKNSSLYQNEFVTNEDLNNENLVIYKNAFRHNKYLYEISKKNNNNLLISSDNKGVLLNMVQESLAYTYVHDFTIKNSPTVKSGGLKVIPIKDPDYILQDIWAIFPKTKELSNLAKEFISQVKSQIIS